MKRFDFSSYWEVEYGLLKQDAIVVGAGLTGLQTAILLKEKDPALRVSVVDRAPWSMGASLKNAGFACFGSIGELLDDLRSRSEEDVFETVRQRYEGLQLLIGTFGVQEVDLQMKGGYELFDFDQRSKLEEALDSLQSFNHILYDLIGEDRVFTYHSNAPYSHFKGSIVNRLEGQLNTGKLYNRILHRTRELQIPVIGGVDVQAWTGGSPVILHGQEGLEMQCERLYLCTNAFAADLAEASVVPARGQVLVTEPLDGIPEGTFMYDRGYYYWRDIDERLLIGGARNADATGETISEFGANPVVVDALKEFVFSKLLGKEVRVEYQWSGIMGMAGNGDKSPLVQQLEAGVYLAARLGGMGVALSSQVARELIELD